MKKFILIFIHVACAFILLIVACENPVNSKIKGNWHSKSDKSSLNITDKKFTMDDEEDYFIKGDTIFTSFKGNQPYTRFVIQKLDDHYLKLLGPDSLAMEYNR